MILLYEIQALHIREIQNSKHKLLGKVGHTTRIENYAATYDYKRQFNYTRTGCFWLFISGRGFCSLHFYVKVFMRNCLQKEETSQ